MKHNVSITMDQKLFRELENIRGREKRSSFIEHLIFLGLKDYASKIDKKTIKTGGISVAMLPISSIEVNHEKMES